MRKSWTNYFMEIAEKVAERSTCDRKHVGCVVVRDNVILSTGYNGSVSGLPHCDDVGHLIVDGHCVGTIHAEKNSICLAAKNGVGLDGAEVYITAFPCWSCFQVLCNSGIKKIYYRDAYRVDDKVVSASKSLGLGLVQVPV